MLTLPLHFANMPIKELVPGSDRNTPLTNFNHLKPRIVNLLVNALQVETETGNAQMLLGCLLLMVQDSSALEEAELRQSDGYSENSARNSGNIFAAGRFFPLLTVLNSDCYKMRGQSMMFFWMLFHVRYSGTFVHLKFLFALFYFIFSIRYTEFV